MKKLFTALLLCAALASCGRDRGSTVTPDVSFTWVYSTGPLNADQRAVYDSVFKCLVDHGWTPSTPAGDYPENIAVVAGLAYWSIPVGGITQFTQMGDDPRARVYINKDYYDHAIVHEPVHWYMQVGNEFHGSAYFTACGGD